ncbi:MAG: hypothetical protein U0P81_08895 [Holophagaceae bacterium]
MSRQPPHPPPIPDSPGRRRLLAALALSPFLGLVGGCTGGGGGDGGGNPAPPTPTRTWRMGFFTLPPRPTVTDTLAMVDHMAPHADLVAIHEELPWTDLLAGMSPDAILDRDKVQLVALLKGKGLRLFFMADLTDGLSRGQEAPQLRALGRSIAEPAVQAAYRAYVLAVARRLAPDFLGLAAETNLTRALGPAPLYTAEVQAANAAAADLKAAQPSLPLLVSVQAETAWGKLPDTGTYAGIARDLQDFPFMQVLGISSYPYFAYARPEDLPSDYYSRLLQGSSLPAMVTEGGWPSASFGSVTSSPETQARYLGVQTRLLESVHAKGLVQLLFADLDLAAWPPPVDGLQAFASLGLTGSSYQAKAAQAAWDLAFARSWTA